MMGGEDQASTAGQARSMQIPKRWPLATNVASRDRDFDKDARLINCYAEKQGSTNEYAVEKRPGFSPAPVIAGAGVGQGIVNYPYIQVGGPHPGLVNTTLYVNANVAYFVFTDETGLQTGPFPLGPVFYTRGTKFQFLGVPTVPTSAGPSILFGGDNTTANFASSCYVYNSGSLTTLAGGGPTGFPVDNVPGFVYLNGFCYVMDFSGTIWQTTAQNVIVGAASWGGLAFITVASDADIAIQLARQGIYVVAIKTWTTQFLYDAGNPVGSSLSPVPGALYNFGCLSSDTFQDLDGVLFWATQSKAGSFRVVMVKEMQETFISTPAIERQLDLGPGSTWYSAAYQHAGHQWYVLTNKTTNKTMVFDVTEGLWMLWTDFLGNYYPVISRCSAPDGSEWHQMAATGNVYKMDADYVYPNDYGNIVPVDIYTPNFDGGVDRIKNLSQMRFNTDQQPQSKLYIRSSDDDYQTWNSYREVSLNQQTPAIADEGSFYRRAYNFRHYANTKFRIKSVDLQMDIGVL